MQLAVSDEKRISDAVITDNRPVFFGMTRRVSWYIPLSNYLRRFMYWKGKVFLPEYESIARL